MNELCAICGVRLGCTRDHVPPKGIFVKPRPSNLITVPACKECNNDASGLDEKFLVYLGCHVSFYGEQGGKLFDDRVLRTLGHNKKLKKTILEGMEKIKLVNSEGMSLGPAYRGQWDSKAHDKIIERTIRGLYFHHFNEILGFESEVKVHFFKKLGELVRVSENWNQYSFGDGQVIYRYARAEQNGKIKSVWLFQFYGSHWAGGSTNSKV
ncbi:HNH endonuclease [Agaribacterium sp. ZY112]|uniref:HNH endonuclease n=1 Tax=Agaribacterium sp. ZY112 TaxID=3233574 RepID=UPI003525B976